EATASVINPQVKEANTIVSKPQAIKAKEATVSVTKPQAKEANAIVSKSLEKVALTKNPKPVVNEKVATTERNDSATRYYKYPATLNPPN
ncbi:MAG: hypothetical protein ACXWC7_15615, partial [Chitinophagaceae bacterium]